MRCGGTGQLALQLLQGLQGIGANLVVVDAADEAVDIFVLQCLAILRQVAGRSILHDHAVQVAQVLVGLVQVVQVRQTHDQIECANAGHVVGQRGGVGSQSLCVRYVAQPCGLRQHVAFHKLQCLQLLLARLRTIDIALFVDGAEVLQLAADVVADMSHVAHKLVANLPIHRFQVLVVDVAFVVGPLGQFLQFALQVHDAVFAGLHGVVAQVLGLSARVVLVGLAVAPPQARVVLHVLLHEEALQLLVVLVLVLGVQHGRVSPFYGPAVVVVDAGEDFVLRHAILGLSHVVESGIVHDAGRVSVLSHPGLVPQFLHGHRARSTEVVAQAQGVAHLVTADEAYELPHQFLVVVHLACGLVDGAGLHHVPVMNQRHHIVVPADVALQDFACARVAHVRSVGIGYGAGQIADDGVSGILHRHDAVLALRPFQCIDGILEAGLLEGLLPVVHAGDEVLAPLFRCGRVDVVYDGLRGFHQFAPAHLLHVLGPGFQTPSADESLRAYALLGVVVRIVAVCEESDARVVVARLHRIGGQQHQRQVQAEGHLARAASRSERTVRVIGLHHAHLGVQGEGLHILDVREARHVVGQREARLGRLAEARRGIVLHQESRHLYLQQAVLFALDVERCNDGVLVRHRDGLVDHLRRVAHVHEEPCAHQQLLVHAAFEVHRLLVHHLAAELAAARGSRGVAGGGEEVAAQQRVGNLEEPILLHLRHAEHALALHAGLGGGLCRGALCLLQHFLRVELSCGFNLPSVAVVRRVPCVDDDGALVVHVQEDGATVGSLCRNHILVLAVGLLLAEGDGQAQVVGKAAVGLQEAVALGVADVLLALEGDDGQVAVLLGRLGASLL